MIVHSTTTLFFTNVLNHSSDLNFPVVWVGCWLPYNKHCNTSIYVLTSIFWILYFWDHNQITQYGSPITSLLHYIYLLLPGRGCLRCHLEGILWSPKHKPQARGNIVGSDGHIKTSIRHWSTSASTATSSTECWCAHHNEQCARLSRAGAQGTVREEALGREMTK